MRPKIATSYRPHGKWGDFLACIIPLLWCINILTNSNLILRLIEWQNESSLFTIRVRARQWYWIYKFELKNFTDILSAPKNIGNNKWQVNTFGDLQVADDYLHILQLRSQNKWIKNFWNNSLQDNTKTNKPRVYIPLEKSIINNDKINTIEFNKNNLFISKNSFFLKKYFFSKNLSIKSNDNSNIAAQITTNFKLYNNFINNNILFKYSELSRFEDFEEYSRFFKKPYSGKLPIRLIKLPIQYETDEFFFKIRFNEKSNILEHKLTQDTMYFTLKQKRYNRKKIIAPRLIKDVDTKTTLKNYPYLTNSKVIKSSDYDVNVLYRLIKKNKKRGENFSNYANKRLLRTKKVLVLPAHVNITVITNSYDIVHSWFIPGLGLKLDCVPGRSTHHTFYIDNVGFYYGQCAEICGRYHHHMPIKLCALPFEHFLLWWNNYGLPKLFNNTNSNKGASYEFRKYSW